MRKHCKEHWDRFKNVATKRLCARDAKIKKLKVKELSAREAQIENLLSKQVEIENLLAKQVQIDHLLAKEIETELLLANVAGVEDLFVDSLNGKPLSCNQTFNNINTDFVRIINNEKPENPGFFNQEVWDKLWDKTLEQRFELEERIKCGRLQERYIQITNGCPPVCPPNGLENCFPTCEEPGICVCPEEIGDCPNVPNDIWGIRTLMPYNDKLCGQSVTDTIRQILSSVAYNLDVINVTGDLTTRVVTILVQVGYLDPNQEGDDKFVYRQIDFGNRQFGPTYDTLYGEKYTGSVLLPSALIRNMINLMPYQFNSAAVQMVVFKEDGVDIDVQNSGLSNIARQIGQNQDAGGSIDAQLLEEWAEASSGGGGGGQIQNSNCYARYFSIVPDITTISTSFNLSVSGSTTQWVAGWLYSGQNVGAYFGINTDESGTFQVLASIWNATSATPGAPFVTATPFEGEGVGYSLRITQENIGNFPITLNTTYLLICNRKNVTPTTVEWEYIISNTSTNVTVNLGTITTPAQFSTISQEGIYQFSEQYGFGLTCNNFPRTVITWSFPATNGIQDACEWVPWTPPPNICGKPVITPTLPNGPVTIEFGPV